MRYLFPYRLVKRGSKIALYGGGRVGKDFFLQLHETKYCEVVAWVDRSYENYEVSKPFDYVKNISRYNFDYCVIALDKLAVAEEVKTELMETYGIAESKIIWSNYYDYSRDFFPEEKTLYLKDLDFYMDLLDDYIDAESPYSKSRYYQSFEPLGLMGDRSNGDRFMKYRMNHFLNKDSTVLDIGCNCGFFSLTVAPFVKTITGVDVDEKFISIANKTRDKCELWNGSFLVKDVFGDGIEGTYDAIFMLSLPANIGVYEKADAIASSIHENGYLFLESHNMKGLNEPYLFHKLVELYRSKGLEKICLHGNLGTGDRDFIVLQKTNG